MSRDADRAAWERFCDEYLRRYRGELIERVNRQMFVGFFGHLPRTEIKPVEFKLKPYDRIQTLKGDHPHEEPSIDPEAEKTFYLLMAHERKG